MGLKITFIFTVTKGTKIKTQMFYEPLKYEGTNTVAYNSVKCTKNQIWITVKKSIYIYKPTAILSKGGINHNIFTAKTEWILIRFWLTLF